MKDCFLFMIITKPNEQETKYKVSLLSILIFFLILHFYFYRLLLFGAIIATFIVITNTNLFEKIESYTTKIPDLCETIVMKFYNRLFPTQNTESPSPATSNKLSQTTEIEYDSSTY